VTLEIRFLDEVRGSGEVVALLTRPPRKQVVENDRVRWQPIGFVSDVSRDQELLVQSKRVLEMALEKNPSVKEAFCEEALQSAGVKSR
jgi:hypothetical protein